MHLSALQVESRGLNRSLVDVSGTLVFMPYRSILVPASLLLPETIPVRATISIGVHGDFGAGVVSNRVCRVVKQHPWKLYRNMSLCPIANPWFAYTSICKWGPVSECCQDLYQIVETMILYSIKCLPQSARYA